MKIRKKKILLVTPYFYPQTGGLENYAYHIAKGLKEKYGWEMVIVTSNHEENKYKEEEMEGLKIYQLAPWFKVSNTPINPRWFFQIKNIIRKEKPDLINAHAPVPFIADASALICGDIPFVLTYHTGSMILKDNLLFDFLIRFYETVVLKLTLKKASKIICSSDYVRLDFLKDYADKATTVTPGVDTDKFKSKITSSKNKVLFVGGLKKAERYKGLEHLISAIKIVKEKPKNVQFSIVGDGDYKPYYENRCRELGIEKNVVFEGKLYRNDLVKKYQQANVFVLPSLFDSCPLVLLEAMACKKPVIGANTCGIPYLIDHGKNGFLVSPKDPEALAEAIIKILKNPKLAKKMGENGYKKVRENFTWDKQVNKTEEVMRNYFSKIKKPN